MNAGKTLNSRHIGNMRGLVVISLNCWWPSLLAPEVVMHIPIVGAAPPHLRKRASTLLTPVGAIGAARGFYRHEEVQEGNLLLGSGAKPHKKAHNAFY